MTLWTVASTRSSRLIPGKENSTLSLWGHGSYFLFDHRTSLCVPESLLRTLLSGSSCRKN